MKFLSFLLIISLFHSKTDWLINWQEAQLKAKQEGKLILLNFSGSDWCVPCIRLHKEVFSDPGFDELVKDNLILVNADFPRLKKNQLSAAQQKINDALAERYNTQGKFPLTVLMNEKGEVIKIYDGYAGEGVASFLGRIRDDIYSYKSR